MSELELLLAEKARRKKSNIPGQAIGGLATGVASFFDTPASLFNIIAANPEIHGMAFEDLTGTKPKSPEIPYYATNAANKLVNNLVGEPNTTGEKAARIGGDIAGSFINPSGILGAGAKGAAKGLTGFAPDKYEAFKAAALTPTLGEVTNSGAVARTQNLLSQIPFAELPLRKAGNKREAELADLFANNAKLAEALTIGEGGNLVEKGAKAYNKKAQEVSNKLYDRAAKGIDSNSRIPLHNTLAAIDKELEAITPQAREILQNSPSGKALIELEHAIKINEGMLPFGDLKNVFRKKLDNMVNSWGQIGDIDEAQIKRIRGTLSKEMNAFILEHNPKAASDLKKADKFWHDFSDRNRGLTNQAINKSSPIDNFNNVLSDLKKGDPKRASIFMQRLPKSEKQVFSATLLKELGIEGEDFNPTKWARNFNKLRPESKKAMMAGFDKGSAHKLESIADALEHVKFTKAHANHSGTTYAGFLLGLLSGGVKGAVTGAVAGVGTSSLFTSPKVIDGLYAMTKAKTPDAMDKIIQKFGFVPRLEILKEVEGHKGNDELQMLIEERNRRSGNL